jgi:uncharacterized protein YndB with AHSA1/START domain
MIKFSISIEVQRSVPVVFEYLTNTERISEWANTIAESRQISDGQFGEGSKMLEVVDLGVRKSEVVWEVVEYVPNQRCTYSTDNDLVKSQVIYTFEAIGASTLLNMHVTSQLKGLIRFVEPLISWRAKRDRKRSLRSIKEILESQKSLE